MNKSQCIITIILFLSFNSYASRNLNNPKLNKKVNSDISLKIIASEEINKAPISTDSKTQVTLQIQDDYIDPYLKSSVYFTQLKLQSYQPNGLVTLPVYGQENLSQLPSSIMPVLEVGALYPMDETFGFTMKWGFLLGGGYSAHDRSVTFGGNQYSEVLHLSTTLVHTGFILAVRPKNYNFFRIYLTPQVGLLTYNQSSTYGYGQFSEQNTFSAIGLGVDIELSKKWYLTAQWTNRNLNSVQNVDIQRNNIDTGLKVTW